MTSYLLWRGTIRGPGGVDHNRHHTFDVQAYRKGRWLDDGTFDREELARAHLSALVRSGEWDGIRIVQIRHQPSGASTRRVILTNMRSADAGRDMIAPPPAETPLCRRVPDIYSLDSRMAISRIFRHFLTENQLTVIELLHLPAAMTQLRQTGNLFSQAVLRVGTDQARRSGAEPRSRIAELERLADAVRRATEAREAARKDLPRFEGAKASAWIEAVRARVGPDETPHHLAAVIARSLSRGRRLIQKMDVVMALAGEGEAPELTAFIDDFIADCLSFPAIMQHLFGMPANRAEMIRAIADFVLRRPPPEGRFHAEMLDRLGQMLDRLEGASCQIVLIEWILREIGSDKPLDSQNPEKEDSLFNSLAVTLTRPDGTLLGGERMAAMLADRKMRVRHSVLRRLGLEEVASRMQKSWRSELADRLTAAPSPVSHVGGDGDGDGEILLDEESRL